MKQDVLVADAQALGDVDGGRQLRDEVVDVGAATKDDLPAAHDGAQCQMQLGVEFTVDRFHRDHQCSRPIRLMLACFPHRAVFRSHRGGMA
jgi:hypothetical protein